jgi:malate dehydrogenase (oxaloacetate-decarboxylating)
MGADRCAIFPAAAKSPPTGAAPAVAMPPEISGSGAGMAIAPLREMHSITSPDSTTTPPEDVLDVSLTGHALLDHPLLNKGSSFSDEERHEFGLLGLLPPHVSSMEEQLLRTYENYSRKTSDLERYIFLVSLQDRNETLFYRLLQEHITEMMPIIYTPVVGLGCQQYSHIYRRPRGLYISHRQIHRLDAILSNAPCQAPDVIVVTDGERILGLGDLGVGGMGIPIGKLSLYTLCAGIDPAKTLPVLLDVGTNNQSLLDDPLYLGSRHRRIPLDEYDAFIDAFVVAIKCRFPHALLQWEDFSKANAARLLAKYRDRLCTFNDDIQGTGAVTLAGLLAATAATHQRLRDQRVVILGAGSSAVGISDQLVTAMVSEGASRAEARAAVWLIDSDSVVHDGRLNLDASKQRYAQPLAHLAGWQVTNPARIGLVDVVRNVRPTVLIGTSAQPGAFTETIVRDMATTTARPIIFPLSNPTSKCEATPADLLAWTNGRALVATGSPFMPVHHDGREIRIGQCNNAFIFPGVGLGIIAARAPHVSDAMFVAAARALSQWSPVRHAPGESLYPTLDQVRKVSRDVALAVATEAQRSGIATRVTAEELNARIDAEVWEPRYVRYRRRVV